MQVHVSLEYLRQRDAAQAYAKAGNLEQALRGAAAAAYEAWRRLPELACDDALESLVARLGKQVARRSPAAGPGVDVLLIASHVMDIGGHSQMIENWLAALGAAGYSAAFVSTEVEPSASAPQRQAVIAHLARSVEYLDPHAPLIQRVRRLAQLIGALHPRLVILCIHPHDVITCAALAACKPCPVVFLNHADHVFWLGKRALDVVVEYRDAGERMTREQRGIQNIERVPLLCEVPAAQGTLDLEAETLSLTVASRYKIEGGAWDYTRAMVDLLRAHPAHHHLLIVNEGAERLDAGLPGDVRERFHLSNQVPHAMLGMCYARADFLVESWPYPGATVRYEALSLGMPLVVTQTLEQPEMTELMGLPEGQPVARGQADFLEQAGRLIRDPAWRAYQAQRGANFYQAHFSRGAVAKRIAELVRRWAA